MNESLSLSCVKLCSTADNGNNTVDPVKPTLNAGGAVYSVDDAVNHVGYGKFQMFVTFLAGLGWFADAVEIIILSLIGDIVACDWTLYTWQNALLTSVVFGGMAVGCPIFGTIADIYGRKKSLAASMILLFLFGAVTAASPSFIWMAVLRGCMGFALGGVAQGLTLCTEYSPTYIRGKAGFYLCCFWAVGTISVILITWAIMVNLNNWRVLLLATSIPALIVVISLKWYPESVRYYLVSNQYDRAQMTLERMAKMNGKKLPPGNLQRVAECSERGRIRDLFNSDNRKATLLFWYISFSVAFSYYGVALISPSIVQKGSLRLAHERSNNSIDFMDNMVSLVKCTKFTQQNYIDLLWTSAAEFPGLVIFTVLIEYCNRRVFLSATCIISGVFTLMLLIETSQKSIILMFLFGARAILLGDIQLVFVMTNEAFPTTLRAIAAGSGSAFCRLGGLVVPYVAQMLVMQNPTAALSMLGSVILLAGIAAIFLPLETRGIDMKESHITE